MRKQILLTLLYMLTSSPAAWAQHQENWVATWGTSPLFALDSPPVWMTPPPAEFLPPDPPPSPIPPVPQELHDQTVRMIVRTSIGGEALRLQLSNAFDAVTRDANAPSRLQAAYNSGDNIHPNDAGNKAMAAAIDISVFTR